MCYELMKTPCRKKRGEAFSSFDSLGKGGQMEATTASIVVRAFSLQSVGGTPALPASIFEGRAQFSSPDSSVPLKLNEPEGELKD